jgi:hypothetical protein
MLELNSPGIYIVQSNSYLLKNEKSKNMLNIFKNDALILHADPEDKRMVFYRRLWPQRIPCIGKCIGGYIVEHIPNCLVFKNKRSNLQRDGDVYDISVIDKLTGSWLYTKQYLE